MAKSIIDKLKKEKPAKAEKTPKPAKAEKTPKPAKAEKAPETAQEDGDKGERRNKRYVRPAPATKKAK